MSGNKTKNLEYQCPDGTKIVCAPDFGTRDEDQDIQKKCDPGLFWELILKRPELSPELRRKIKKGRRLGGPGIQEIARVAERAMFDIETRPDYVLSFQITQSTTSRSRVNVNIAATSVPWTKSTTEEGGQRMVCMDVALSKGNLKCSMRIMRLRYDGEERRVLVSKHLCDQLAERTQIRGSHVAFIARSLRSGIRRIRKQQSGEPLLEVTDLNGGLIGYCPVGSKFGGLHFARESVAERFRKELTKDQAWWRLKTFLRPDYFSENSDGSLTANRRGRANTDGEGRQS